MQIENNIRLTEDIFALDLGGEFPYRQVRPGQFVHVRIGGGITHPLRRPLSIAACDPRLGRLTLVYRVVGAGTAWLSRQGAGCAVDVLGPLGTGFPLASGGGPILVVGGGVGIPPLYELVRRLPVDKDRLDIVLGYKNKGEVFWPDKFMPFGAVTICTEDGSLGVKGLVTDALKSKNWTALYACGPRPMLRALKECFAGENIAGYVSLEERMACGIGACLGCVCTSADGRGTKRICTDGPVFPWEEVTL